MAAEEALARARRGDVRVTLAEPDGRLGQCGGTKRRSSPAGTGSFGYLSHRGAQHRCERVARLALCGLACLRSGTEPRASGVPDRMEPVVIAPAAPEADTNLTLAAVFPTIGRYAVSGQQSLRGARLAASRS